MEYRVKITFLAENRAEPPFAAEHGLAMLLEYRGSAILFDTGAGGVFEHNCRLLGIDPRRFDQVVLSHGHNDHTGGIARIEAGRVWFAPGIARRRFSLHAGRPPRELSMPAAGIYAAMGGGRGTVVTSPREIAAGVWLTGPIPHHSGEDCGGPFFFDREGRHPDQIVDEQALVFDCGVVVTGCCHAGIINTLEWCGRFRPEIRIHTVVGGLHLRDAGEDRLEKTASELRRRGVRRVIVGHCTGDAAVERLRGWLPECGITVPAAGEDFRL